MGKQQEYFAPGATFYHLGVFGIEIDAMWLAPEEAGRGQTINVAQSN